MVPLLAVAACADPSPPEQVVHVGSHETPHISPRRVPVELPSQYALPERTTTTRAAHSRPVATTAASGGVRVVSSTAFCLTGTMANGQRVFAGAVAMNGEPFGSRWRVVDTGRVYVVADRIGHSSQFDIAMPGDCAGAIRYGRRTIRIERAG